MLQMHVKQIASEAVVLWLIFCHRSFCVRLPPKRCASLEQLIARTSDLHHSTQRLELYKLKAMYKSRIFLFNLVPELHHLTTAAGEADCTDHDLGLSLHHTPNNLFTHIHSLTYAHIHTPTKMHGMKRCKFLKDFLNCRPQFLLASARGQA